MRFSTLVATGLSVSVVAALPTPQKTDPERLSALLRLVPVPEPTLIASLSPIPVAASNQQSDEKAEM
jgi:hypothetical protein